MLSYILFAFAGILSGILAGLLGIGGGIIVVPALIYIFSLLGFEHSSIMQMAAGTSLSAMIVTAAAATKSHHQRDVILWPLFLYLLPGLVLGTIFGAYLASLLNTEVLKIIFGIFLIFIALKMFFLKHTETKDVLPGWLGKNLIGFCVGVCSGLLGVGGGMLIIPLLIYFGISLRNASGTSAPVALTVAMVGTCSVIVTGWHVANMPALSTGYIYWPAAISIAIFSFLSVPIGSKLAHILSVPIVSKIFAVILLITACDLIL
jgi:uncharacterized membrane protein YfcA